MSKLPQRQRKETSSWLNTITITIIIITGTGDARLSSSWCHRAGTVTIIITITIITATGIGDETVLRVQQRGFRITREPPSSVARLFLRGAMQVTIGAVENGVCR